MLDEKDLTPETEYNIKWSAASLYTGGADTVRIFMSRFLCSRLTETTHDALWPVMFMCHHLDRVFDSFVFSSNDDAP